MISLELWAVNRESVGKEARQIRSAARTAAATEVLQLGVFWPFSGIQNTRGWARGKGKLLIFLHVMCFHLGFLFTCFQNVFIQVVCIWLLYRGVGAAFESNIQKLKNIRANHISKLSLFWPTHDTIFNWRNVYTRGYCSQSTQLLVCYLVHGANFIANYRNSAC